MNIAKVGKMRQFLQQRQVQQAALIQRPRFANVYSLTPLAGGRVEDVNVRVAVDEKKAIGGGRDTGRLGRVHDFLVARLAAL